MLKIFFYFFLILPFFLKSHSPKAWDKGSDHWNRLENYVSAKNNEVPFRSTENELYPFQDYSETRSGSKRSLKFRTVDLPSHYNWKTSYRHRQYDGDASGHSMRRRRKLKKKHRHFLKKIYTKLFYYPKKRRTFVKKPLVSDDSALRTVPKKVWGLFGKSEKSLKEKKRLDMEASFQNMRRKEKNNTHLEKDETLWSHVFSDDNIEDTQ